MPFTRNDGTPAGVAAAPAAGAPAPGSGVNPFTGKPYAPAAKSASGTGAINPFTGRPYVPYTKNAALQPHKGGGILDFAKGPIAAAFDIASRPAYSVGNLIRGDYGEAAKPFYKQAFHRVLPGQALAERGLLPSGKLGSVLQFASDVALDPTTYATFGVGGVAKGVAESALARAASERFTERVLADAARGIRTPVSAAAAHGLEQALIKETAGGAGKALTLGVRVPGTRGKVIPLAESQRAYRAAQAVGGKVGGSRVGIALKEGLLPQGAESKAVWATYAAARRAGEAEKHAVSRQAVDLAKDVRVAARASGMPLPQAHDLITRYLDQPDVYAGQLPDALKPVAVKARQAFDEFHALEQDAGIKKGIVESYVPHLPATPKDRHLLQTQFSRGPGTPFWKKERDLPNLSAWDQAGLKPETNIARLLEVRGHSSVDERVRQAFDQTIAGGLGKPTDQVAAHAAWREFPATHLGDVSVPRDVAAAVQRVYDRITPSVTTSGVDSTKRFIARVNGGWKSLALLSPGFHSRNLQSDLMAAYWAGARNPRSFVQAARVLHGDGAVRVKGRTFTAQEITALAEAHGVIRTGFAGKEIRQGINDLSTKRGRIAAPGSGTIARGSHAVGTARENTVRLGLFLERLKAGDHAAQAAEITRQYLFDYGDVGRFVAAARKFWFPFITYPSKAIPMTARTFAKRPGIPATLAKLQAETNTSAGIDTGSLPVGSRASFALPIPDVVKQALGAPTGQPLLFNPESVLPYGQLNSLDPRQLSHYVAGLTSPFVKTPVEVATKHSFFTGHPFPARAKAPAVIAALEKLGVPIPGYGPKTDLFTHKQVPGYSPSADDVLRMFPQFGQAAGLIPGGGSDSARLAYARFLGGLSLSPYDRARAAFYAAKFGGK